MCKGQRLVKRCSAWVRSRFSSMRKYRFGDFELDLDAVQLLSKGEPVKLERRPLDLLILLAGRQGRLVTREEIIAALWPPKIVIDFEMGLNTLVRKVRTALHDSADQPRFIETVPGRGYRFIAAVTEGAPAVSPDHEGAAPVTASEAMARAAAPQWRRRAMPALLLLLVAAVAILLCDSYRSANARPMPRLAPASIVVATAALRSPARPRCSRIRSNACADSPSTNFAVACSNAFSGLSARGAENQADSGQG
jgi:DNA-binding winged helix-turn-helix (wHTH) protein